MGKFRLSLYIVIGIFLSGCGCFAYTDNCNLVRDYNVIGELAGNFKNAFDATAGRELLAEDGLKRALINLKAYCCNNGILRDTCDPQEKNNINNIVKSDYPLSPYLYDHLVSVMLRRLSEYNYSGVEGDPQAVEWYEYLSGVAHNTGGTIPMDLESKEKAFRKIDDNWINNVAPKYRLTLYNGVSSTSFLNFVENPQGSETTQITDLEKIKNYSKWDLTTKHLNVCQLATRLSLRLGNFNSSDLALAEQKCIDRVYDILFNYTYLYSDIIVTQSNLLSQRLFDNYYYYLNTRLSNLNTTVARINSYFFGVTRLVGKITPQCN